MMGRHAAPGTEPGVLGAVFDASRYVRSGGHPVFTVGRRTSSAGSTTRRRWTRCTTATRGSAASWSRTASSGWS